MSEIWRYVSANATGCWGVYEWAKMVHCHLNCNWNSGKLIRFSSFSTQNGHCKEWIGNHLKIKHPDYVHMAPLQFAFYGQLRTNFAPKMTFTKLKIAFNICTRVIRHVHVQGLWRQLGVNNMSNTVVQQNFSQLIPCVCTNSLMHVYFFVSMESVNSSCVEINECSFAYFNHIKRSSAHMATFRPSTPTFHNFDSKLGDANCSYWIFHVFGDSPGCRAKLLYSQKPEFCP